jgi:hypothetical protein
MAFKVKDFEWCVEFFQEVFSMPLRLSLGGKPHLKTSCKTAMCAFKEMIDAGQL